MERQILGAMVLRWGISAVRVSFYVFRNPFFT